MILYIIWIRINIISFSFLYVFFKAKYLNKIGKKYFSQEGCVCVCVFDNGNVNWCMLGRAFLCRTGHFCVQPCILLSNRAFLCQMSVIMLHEKSFQTNNNNHQVRQWCGIQNGKKLIGLCKEIIFKINDIIFLNIEWRTPYPLTNFEDPFGLRASVSFLDSVMCCFLFIWTLASSQTLMVNWQN